MMRRTILEAIKSFKKIKITTIINGICKEKDYIAIATNLLELKLREDVGFVSFDLAQLTVMIEDEFILIF